MLIITNTKQHRWTAYGRRFALLFGLHGYSDAFALEESMEHITGGTHCNMEHRFSASRLRWTVACSFWHLVLGTHHGIWNAPQSFFDLLLRLPGRHLQVIHSGLAALSGTDSGYDFVDGDEGRTHGDGSALVADWASPAPSTIGRSSY